jgi:branched-chain amino acid transport system ATP-binding protein
VLLVEHDMRIIFRVCERIQVLDYGKTIAVGTPEEIRTDRRVVAAYLGVKGAKLAASH